MGKFALEIDTIDIIDTIESIAIIYRGIEQLVAREAHYLKVGGSSPSPATRRDARWTLSKG